MKLRHLMPLYTPPLAYVGMSIQRCGSAHTTRLDSGGDFLQVGGGYVTWRRGADVRAYEPYCGVRFTQTPDPAPDSVVHIDGWIYTSALVAADRYRIMRAPYPSCAELTTPRAVRVQSGGHGRVAQLHNWSPAASDWTQERLPLVVHHARSLTVRPGAEVTVQTQYGTRLLRWRLGAGPWHEARGGGYRWRFRAPATITPTTLRLAVRTMLGERGTFALPVR